MHSLLLVDNEPGFLDLGRIHLEKMGDFAVDTTLSASQALEMMEAARYDAVISDYQMAGTDGIALLKTLRSWNDTTPFILFTGKGREEVVIEALNAGADFYIQKGGDPTAQFAELANMIRYAISRREAEEGLRERARLYQVLAESSPDMIYLVDRDGVILYVNQKAAQAFGVSPADLIGQRTDRILPPDMARHYMEGITRVLATREGRQIEMRERFPGGARWICMRLVPVRDPEGEVAQILGVLTDVTDRKRAEEALRQAHHQLQLLTEITATISSTA